MSDSNSRAEAARRKILESGDPELIGRLHLLEATAAGQGGAGQGGARGGSPGGAPQPGPFAGGAVPGMLGIGLAAAGGAWLGTVLGGMALSREMEQAFAEVAEGMGLDLGGMDGGAGPVDTGHEAGHEAGEDGDFFGGFDDFFDI